MGDPTKDAPGVPRASSGSGVSGDGHDRERLQRALEEIEIYRDLYEEAPIAYVREDLDSRVSYTEMLKFNLVKNRAN